MNKRSKSRAFNAKTFMVWFFVIIMSFSIGGFLFGGNGDSTTVRYNGFNLYTQGNVWMTKIDGKAMPFSYLPSDLEAIRVDSGAKAMLSGKLSVYLTFQPGVPDLRIIDLARFELKEDFTKFYGAYLIDGVANQTTTYQLPVITCLNATAFQPVIFLNPIEENASEQAIIRLDGNCVILEGSSDSFIMLKDRLMYVMAGVMP